MLTPKVSRWLVVLSALALVAVSASCGDDGAADAKKDEQAARKAAVAVLEPERRLTIEVSGARSAKFTGTSKLKVITRKGVGTQLQFSAAALEPLDKLHTDPNTIVKPEIGVVGMYKGDGSYTIPAGLGIPPKKGPTVPVAASGAQSVSVAAVTFTTLNPLGDVRFGYVLEPCKVTLSEDATVGSADCPALVSYEGEKVSLKYSWSK